ncbi:hypothetical protein Lal_00041674, partial [Lupinus albus]
LFIPNAVLYGVKQSKFNGLLNDDDKKRSEVSKLQIYTLGIDEFFRVTNCKSTKEMCNTLEITHEGTEEVKQRETPRFTKEIHSLNKSLDCPWQSALK